MLKGLLVQEEFTVGRLHVATLMKRMGIEALYRKPNTSKPAPGPEAAASLTLPGTLNGRMATRVPRTGAALRWC